MWLIWCFRELIAPARNSILLMHFVLLNYFMCFMCYWLFLWAIMLGFVVHLFFLVFLLVTDSLLAFKVKNFIFTVIQLFDFLVFSMVISESCFSSTAELCFKCFKISSCSLIELLWIWCFWVVIYFGDFILSFYYLIASYLFLILHCRWRWWLMPVFKDCSIWWK